MATSQQLIEPSAIELEQVTPHDRSRWGIIWLLSLGAVIAFASRSNISAALTLKPFIQSFHLTDVDRGAINSAFFWSYAALQIPTGWIVDRYGVKWPYAISLVIWSLAAAATGLTHTIPALLAMRVVTGAGEAIVTPASYRWMRDNFDEKDSGLAIGIYMIGTKLGNALGIPMAVYLIQKYNWHLMFYIIGLGGLLWLIPWLLLVKDGRKVATKVKKAVAVVPFKNIMKSPVVWGTIVINFCYNYFVFYCSTWMPAYMVEARHMSLAKMGLFSFFSFLGITIVALVSGWVADLIIKRGGDAVFVRKAFILSGFVIACTELLGVKASSLNVALFWAIVSLSGIGLATANHLALCRVTLIPAGAAGLVSGVQNVSTSLAGLASPLISAWLKQKSGGGYTLPMEAIFVVLVIGALTVLVVLRREWAPKAELPIIEGA